MVLFDILQGFYNLRKVIKKEVGSNANYLIYQAGIKGGISFFGPMIRSGRLDPGPQGFTKGLSVLTDGGFGHFQITEMDWEKGWAKVICHSSFEGWAYARKRKKTRRASCDYARGIILGFMEATHRYAGTGLAGRLDCVETSCLATGQPQCTFIIGTRASISKHGYECPKPGKSIQEQLKELVLEKTTEIREANRFNERILNNAPVGVLTLNSKGMITSANPAMSRIIGISSAQLVGKYPGDEEAIFSKGLADQLFRALKGEHFDLVDYRLDAKGQEPRFVTVRSIHLKNTRGLVEGLLCIMEDTTERKQIETHMIKAGKLAAMGELASGMAHEINNPMATVAGYAEELLDLIHEKETLAPEDIEEFEKDLTVIIEQSQRCKRIIQGLLNFARQEQYQLVTTDLNELIEKTLLLIEPHAKLSNLRLLEDLDQNLPMVVTDPSQLQQVFLNILRNALDAVSSDGIIGISSCYEKGLFQIRFRDNGAGIPKANQKKIFEPFFTTKPTGKGTGLGLSICNSIMEKLQGSIDVESQMGSGTTFIVNIPENWLKTEEKWRAS